MLEFGTFAVGGEDGGEHELVEMGVVDGKCDVCFAPGREVFCGSEEHF